MTFKNIIAYHYMQIFQIVWDVMATEIAWIQIIFKVQGDI